MAIAVALGITVVYPAQAQAPVIKMLSAENFASAFPKSYASKQLSYMGFGKAEFGCLNNLWTKESHWNHLADNPKSTAFGIAQILGEKSKLPHVQIGKGLRYIIKRYDTPCNAWRFWKRHNYY